MNNDGIRLDIMNKFYMRVLYNCLFMNVFIIIVDSRYHGSNSKKLPYTNIKNFQVIYYIINKLEYIKISISYMYTRINSILISMSIALVLTHSMIKVTPKLNLKSEVALDILILEI